MRFFFFVWSSDNLRQNCYPVVWLKPDFDCRYCPFSVCKRLNIKGQFHGNTVLFSGWNPSVPFYEQPPFLTPLVICTSKFYRSLWVKVSRCNRNDKKLWIFFARILLGLKNQVFSWFCILKNGMFPKQSQVCSGLERRWGDFQVEIKALSTLPFSKFHLIHFPLSSKGTKQ